MDATTMAHMLRMMMVMQESSNAAPAPAPVQSPAQSLPAVAPMFAAPTAAQLAANAAEDARERFATQLVCLTNMGFFDQQLNLELLIVHGGDLRKTYDALRLMESK
jgi:hypothetical protein